MPDAETTEHSAEETPIYCIQVKGHLRAEWAGWFGDMAITLAESGDTLLTGALDQAALHGLLRKVRDLGLPLLAVNRVGGSERSPFEPPDSMPRNASEMFQQE
jgi:hypothetical protein